MSRVDAVYQVAKTLAAEMSYNILIEASLEDLIVTVNHKMYTDNWKPIGGYRRHEVIIRHPIDGLKRIEGYAQTMVKDKS